MAYVVVYVNTSKSLHLMSVDRADSGHEHFLEAYMQKLNDLKVQRRWISRINGCSDCIARDQGILSDHVAKVHQQVENLEFSVRQTEITAEQMEAEAGHLIETTNKLEAQLSATNQALDLLTEFTSNLANELDLLRNDISEMTKTLAPVTKTKAVVMHSLLSYQAELINIKPEYHRKMASLESLKATARIEEAKSFDLSKEYDRVQEQSYSIQATYENLCVEKRQWQQTLLQARAALREKQKEIREANSRIAQENKDIQIHLRHSIESLVRDNARKREVFWRVKEAENTQFQKSREASDQLAQEREERQKLEKRNAELIDALAVVKRQEMTIQKKIQSNGMLIRGQQAQHAYRQEYLLTCIDSNDQLSMQECDKIMQIEKEIQDLKDEIRLKRSRNEAYKRIKQKRGQET